jgi:calcium-dependent protein kinase
MKKVKIGKFSFTDPCWANMSDKAKDFITKLLIYDPEQRISAEKALQHPWITEMSLQQVDSSVAMGALSNLKTFRADQKLKQATFAFIASQLLTKQEKENLSKIFKAIDTNSDGKLSKEEILVGYDKFFGKAMEKEDIEKMFDAVDIDKSGFIDYSEFVIASMNEKQLLTNEKLQSAFKMFDKDGSGFISSDEIKQILGFGKNMSEEAVNDIIKQVDANGDG